jgi:DNA-binding transcriptional regulator YiaG
MTGAALKRHRGRLGLTQVQLAERLEVHEITVVRWETGTVKIPKVVAMAIELLVRKEGTKHSNG